MRALAALLALLALVLSACIHDWEEWLPQDTGGGGTGTAGTGLSGGGTQTGTLTGGGGTNTGTVPGTCPTIEDTTPMVKVVTLLGTAMCIDQTEVTKGQYYAWLQTNPAEGSQPAHCSYNTNPGDLVPQDPNWTAVEGGTGINLPVGGADWCDALYYCTDVGKRLCGEIGTGANVTPSQFADPYQSEWSNACTERGQQAYPYGGDYGATTCNGLDAGNGSTVDVGSMTACVSPSGVLDLSGNIWEWENSCSGESGGSDLCKVRGGGFNSAHGDLLCGKDNPTARSLENITLGFRCCADPLL